MSAIQSLCTSLTVVNRYPARLDSDILDVEDEDVLLSEEKKLLAHIVVLSKEQKELYDEMVAMDVSLQRTHETVMLMYTRLQDELKALIFKKNGTKGSEKLENTFSDDDYDGFDPDHKHEEEVKVSAKANKLFQKISLKSHPDRTKHLSAAEQKYLSDIFRKATLLRNADDYLGLQNLWNALSKNIGLLKYLLIRVNELKREAKDLEEEIVEMKSSSMYMMLIDYNQPSTRHLVERHFLNLMNMRIQDISTKIARLRSSN